MTARKLKIIRAILNVLENLDGGQLTESVLHAEVNLHVTPTATLGEFDDAIQYCDQARWITGVSGKFGGRKWNLSDLGAAARLEMK
jgi:hypothetical protein